MLKALAFSLSMPACASLNSACYAPQKYLWQWVFFRASNRASMQKSSSKVWLIFLTCRLRSLRVNRGPSSCRRAPTAGPACPFLGCFFSSKMYLWCLYRHQQPTLALLSMFFPEADAAPVPLAYMASVAVF